MKNTVCLTSFARAVANHARALERYRAAKNNSLLSSTYSETWMDMVREWAGYARLYRAQIVKGCQ